MLMRPGEVHAPRTKTRPASREGLMDDDLTPLAG
jgi:hypothetical protein